MKRRHHKRSRTPGKPAEIVLPAGKLPADLLARLLSETVLVDPTVLQGPGIGNDAAVIGPPLDEMLVITSDPITFTSTAVGHHLLAVNINDIVTTGACPRWLMLTLLFPPGTTDRAVESLFLDIGDACRDYEITLVGGHTEITDAVTRPVAVGVLVGTVKRDRKVDPSRAQPGDHVLLIGPIAIEGTAVLANQRGEEIAAALGTEMRQRASDLLTHPGICIRDAAFLAVSRYLAHALHDPTEGGLATALREVSAATGWGIEAHAEAVPILPETTALCRHFGIDPFGLLASGSLLVVLPQSEATRLQRAADKLLNLPASIIGTLSAERRCVWKDPQGLTTEIPVFARDELARVLEEAPTPPRRAKEARHLPDETSGSGT